MISDYNKNKSRTISIENSNFSLQPLASFFPQTKEPFFYQDIKRRVFFYRNVFLLLGIIFLCLTEILLLHTPNWNFKLLFGHGAPFKTLFATMSGSLAIASLWLGCSLRAGIEAIYENSRKAKRKLKKLYLSSSLSPIEKQKYQLLKEEIRQLSRKAVFEYETLEKRELNTKMKNALILQMIERQKEALIRCIRDFHPNS